MLSACVGTLDSGNPDDMLSVKRDSSSLIFAGVEAVVPISHNKIEVYFYPAKGGSEKYSYKVYYGGEPIPQVTASDVLNTDYRGLLRFTLTGLYPAKEYIIRVDVEDQETREYTKTNNTLSASTFPNKVADFFGITNVSNLPGIDGVDSLKVRWMHAECIDALRCDQATDPIGYEVILLDRTNMGLNPSSFNNRDLTQSDGRYVKSVTFSSSSNLNETVVRGLRGDTEYYVLVRAIHKGTIDDINNIKLRSELNNNYMQIKTFSNELSSIDFDDESFKLTNLGGEIGLTSVNVNWEPAIGVFDHYRVFYAPKTAGLTPADINQCKQVLLETDNQASTVLCSKVHYTSAEKVTTGLLRNKDYDFILVICLTNSCESGSRYVSPMKTVRVAPEEPVFGGITAIVEATSLEEFGQLKLTFEPVDHSISYIDGYIVEYKGNTDVLAGRDYEVFNVNDSSYVDGNLSLLPYDVEKARHLIVEGVNYNTSDAYCFRIFPFIYEDDGTRAKYENQNWKCLVSPQYKAPNQYQFKGLRNVMTQDMQITLRWEVPTTGVFAEYELYFINSSENLPLFGTAPEELDNWSTAPTSKYDRITLQPWQTEITFDGFQPGDTYQFGILTNYNTESGKLRSETNSNVLTCTFQSEMNNMCVGGY